MKSLRSVQHKVLVNELKKLRAEVGITQTELANRLGVQQSFVAKVEGLERRLDVVEFVNWLAALNLIEKSSEVLDRIQKPTL